MKRIAVGASAALALVVTVTLGVAQTPTKIEVLRNPGCGCCLKWVSLLEQAGFKATVKESPEIQAFKDSKGVPKSVRSCHTGVVNGYVIEGHVPVADVKRLLKTRPAVLGIAAPGMPAGLPGMETPDGTKEPFDVVSFDKTGTTAVFASHR
jgi:hypothetical protein